MFYGEAFLHFDILVHFLEGSCSTSLIKIDQDIFPLIISSITFTRSLVQKVQIRAILISKHLYLYPTQQNAMVSIRTQSRHSWFLVSRQSLFSRLSPVHPLQHALFSSYVVVSVLFSSLLQNVRGFLLQNVNSLIKFWCHTSGQRPLYDRPLKLK